ncbi:MAG TPA: PLP-dependent aminotransferase family protein [Polyangiaceae bacterium]
MDEATDLPLFLRISRAIVRDIARGRLRAGDPLPGSRTLAETLRVHRSTVVAAYAELATQGWLVSRQGGATCVARVPPEVTARRFAASAALRPSVPSRTGFAVEPAPTRGIGYPLVAPGALMLWGGVPDLRLVPPQLLGLLVRAYRRATKQHGRALLGYARSARGHVRLRAALAELVSSTRGLAANADSLLITRGSQMALDLVARSLLRPGDVVAVEALGYPSAFNMFRRAGALVVPVALDAQGLDVAALAKLSAKRRVRLVYLTPHHQYPTTVTLAPARRLALLDLAQREQIAIVEDDYDQEFHYDGRPVLPLASSDPHGNVIYVGTLAKSLAPGLRLAFVVAPEPLLERMEYERLLADRQGDHVLECAVAELLEDGELQRHVRRVRRVYEQRRDAFCAALERELGGAISYRRPAGGLALWARAAPDLDVETWQARAAERGVHFQIGRQFSLTGRALPYARFGYALLDERELALAVRRLVQSLPTRGRRGA